LEWIATFWSHGFGDELELELDALADPSHPTQLQLTITGKKAIPYICPLLSLRWRSNFRLKPANEHPEIISLSKIFHSFTTLLLKENLATSNLTLFLFNFNE